MTSWTRRRAPLFFALTALLAGTTGACLPAFAADHARSKNAEQMSFLFRDTPIAELFEMISRKERVNIVLGHGVNGNVSVNLYDMTVRQAIYAIAEAGG